MYFALGYDTSMITGILSGDEKIYHVFDDDSHAQRRHTRDLSVIEPTAKEWEEFFKVCESVSIWGLGDKSKFLSEDMYYQPSPRAYWKLELEYPNRVLKPGLPVKYI